MYYKFGGINEEQVIHRNIYAKNYVFQVGHSLCRTNRLAYQSYLENL